MNKKTITVFLLFTICAPISIAESMKIEMIPMKNRMVEDVIPIIKPLIIKGGTVTGMNNQLILKTTPSNIELIKSILEQIDNAPRKLLISVKRNNNNEFNKKEGGFSIKYDSKNIQIESVDTGEKGIIVQNKNSKGDLIRYRKSHEESREQEGNIFYVNTLEGNPAFINTGQLMPVRNQTTVTTSGTTVVQDNIGYHNINSGFYVTPKLQADNVVLTISPKFTELNKNEKNVINVQNVSTTVHGRLGEWISIGGINQSSNNSDKRNLINKEQYNSEKSNIFVKVEEIK
jgi:type II secretory pathway component GspD/PulD (secretin)